MNKFVLSVLGCDRPGIVAKVSGILTDHDCNIEDLTQTVLQTEFAAIFIFSIPPGVQDNLYKCLKTELEPDGLSVRLKRMDTDCVFLPVSDPFVAVAIGPDHKGQIAALTRGISQYGCNITSIKAINRSDLYPEKIVIIIEMDVPSKIVISEMRLELERAARQLGLQLSLQHQDIFESIHRI
ncbi:glycine cleavage system protein R [Desulfonatronovibrio magnus]|uniref:glycine cleavage system protein R n=1 Tax=Desulfonatronovibrio magnus TaxID=698827 RepID=UPI0005EAFD19|nr:ACT domain-containing protein [Desulfonatronovibrio magnus]